MLRASVSESDESELSFRHPARKIVISVAENSRLKIIVFGMLDPSLSALLFWCVDIEG